MHKNTPENALKLRDVVKLTRSAFYSDEAIEYVNTSIGLSLLID